MLSTITERPLLIKIKTACETRAVAFIANGEYLLSGNDEGVQIWRVQDGTQISRIEAKFVRCLAVSNDGKWIAAGTYSGDVFIWDAKTYEEVFSHAEGDNYPILGIDFSPDSTRLVNASGYCMASIWEVASRKRVLGPFRHESWVLAVKYSPLGDRIATSTPSSVQVYNSNDGQLLVDIREEVRQYFNTGFLWSGDHLFILSDNMTKIKRVNASTGSTIAEWPSPDVNNHSRIALPRHEQFIAYSVGRTITFSDTSTHNILGFIKHPAGNITSIAISQDDRFVAVGGGSKLTIHCLYRITDSIPPVRLHPTFREPNIQVNADAFESWKHDQLTNADTLLSAEIDMFENPNHHVLAGRALVRTRLLKWDAALIDAQQSIDIQSSVIGYIAKSVALIGMGEREKGYRACDIAYKYFRSVHGCFLLLIKAVIVFMAGEHEDAMSLIDKLIDMTYLNPHCCTVQAYMCLLLANMQMESNDYQGAIQLFKRAQTRLQRYESSPLDLISLISGWKFDRLVVTIEQNLCKALYGAGRTQEGDFFLLDQVFTSKPRPAVEWVSDFTQRCLSILGRDDASRCNQIETLHATFSSPMPIPLLREWAKSTLAISSWKDALVASASFMVPRSMIYRIVCEHFGTMDRLTDASECFRQMMDEFAERSNVHDNLAGWDLDFRCYFANKLQHLGDTAMGTGSHDDAIYQYSAALSLDSTASHGLLVKRSKAFLARSSWVDALNDANKAMMLDPLSPWGYERKHAALLMKGDYKGALEAFQAMLSKISQSPDLSVREHRDKYVDPGATRETIRKAVQDVIREFPPVLIHTISGRLLNKSEQAVTFESLPLFKQLICSMTTHIDHARIKDNVTEYYRYAMFSHKWEDDEPSFEKVVHAVVYDLEDSPTHDKLKMFCKIVQDVGLHWAWSDTCCINKANHFVLQEALVSMFRWYHGSAVTIVHLRGVRSPSKRGDLSKSIWNRRAWTYQEYHASKVVRFYNEDWTLYMDIDIPNHKESPEIISEMEEATGVPAQTFMTLQPGLDNIREKLCLASRRETSLVEDTAYSLLGIFSTSLPVVYGEGNQALGRLLAQLLTNSGDTNILAWTGRSGSFNSCIPADIIVFTGSATTHIPLAILGPQMDAMTTRLRSSLNLTLAVKLYKRLQELLVPSFTGQRMKLPCLTFKLGPALETQSISGRAFRAKTNALGTVEIMTTEDISRLDSLILVHPWIDFLLDRQPVGCIRETLPEENTNDHSLNDDSPPLVEPLNTPWVAKQTQSPGLVARLGSLFSARSRDVASLLSPSSVSPSDERMQSLRLIARLRRPFGALLFTPIRRNVAEYRRIASESTITVQIQQNTSLKVLIDSVQMLDVL